MLVNAKEVCSHTNHTSNSLGLVGFVLFLKGVQYAGQYCALMPTMQPLSLHHGILACTGPNLPGWDKVAIAVYYQSREQLQPIPTRCASSGPLLARLLQDKPPLFIIPIKTHSPGVFFPKMHDFEFVHRPGRAM